MTNCGTYAGMQAHSRRNEPPCRPCRDAANEYQRQRRRDPKVRAQDAAQNNARTRAAWRLVAENRRRFRELVAEELRTAETGAKP